ncbi:hypothetical protein Mal4_23210 [Maioricimonas rarisocia]|uniref:Uncharacterized protein n=1 Tax=Maioricimonas rarisocia TaxID=2528026 RepID=A0A517Z6F5_9PLAN|nr:hypothetical protein [Maioricimonas rarisocia]QDU38001.1 hypothetical protein Mal4_23210 [Maioricimonas rarisocia]
MRQSAWRLLTVAMVALSAVAGGCSDTTSEADHHLEHDIPEHKPASFSDAVAELELRGKSLAQQPINGKRLAELTDIINWLPELAADSDLRRQQWEQVQQTSHELSGIVSHLGEEPVTSTEQETWTRSVAVLQKLVPDADALGPTASGKARSHQHHSHHDHGDSPAHETETEQ